MKINKLKAITISIWYGIIMIVKRFITIFTYPIAYSAYDWVMDGVERKNYTRPAKIFANPIKWLMWLHYDDDQPKQGADWYRTQNILLNKMTLPLNKLETFICAYGWTAIRNPMYNINYVYFGNQSNIIYYKVAYGKYDWNKKLRSSNGDNGVQLVWFLTEKKQNRFIFSLAKKPFGIPLTFYFGWNPDFNGRFTVAVKLK